MRGRPLIEWLGFAVIWSLLLIPLLQITGGPTGQSDTHSPDQAGNTNRVTAWLRLAFSDPPELLTVYSAGAEVWRKEDPSEEAEQLVDLAMDAGSPDVSIEARWSDAERRAVSVEVDPMEGKAVRTLLWSETKALQERVIFR